MADPLSQGVSLSDVIRILALIAQPPNQRDRPVDGDLLGDYSFWFDGGACQFITGMTHYEFADGTTASTPVLPGLAIGITFPNGEVVHVEQKRKT